ncbi:MAG: hypothetical protein RI539_04960 [Spiribacter sp.]|jgi:tetratricopeptide (TPR) repeat protein|nr:hypothetical protein [Spiribacter sp.]MDR9489680.1 hypothetical protein [Spiribacter sp.]
MKHLTVFPLIAPLLILLVGCSTAGSLGTSNAIEQLESADRAFRTGDLEQATADYKAVIRRSDDLASPHFQLGRLAYQKAKLKQAQTHFAAALSIDANHVPATYNLAIIHLQQARLLLSEHKRLAPVSAEKPALVAVRKAIESIGKANRQESR